MHTPVSFFFLTMDLARWEGGTTSHGHYQSHAGEEEEGIATPIC